MPPLGGLGRGCFYLHFLVLFLRQQLAEGQVSQGTFGNQPRRVRVAICLPRLIHGSWVPFTVLVTFNRLKELSTDVAAIAAAVKAADSQLLEVSADDAQVRHACTRVMVFFVACMFLLSPKLSDLNMVLLTVIVTLFSLVSKTTCTLC